MFGKILIFLATFASLFSIICYFLAEKKFPKLKLFAGISFYVMASSILVAAGYLMYNIMIHNFQFTYIWEYSSRELSNFFLMSTFYAGQQGSFMLWACTLTLVGIFLKFNIRNIGYENYTMAFYSLILLFLFIIMLFKSPFDYVWETFASDNVKFGFIPENGRGLNPILQNYWITIHPPILFLGYSLLAVPFALALAGLLKRDYHKWLDKAIPWTLFGSGVLGLGIMMGGFWAYETLGWGGFWAWDPVENSSLIPWLIATALVHTFLVQRRTGGLIRTNFVLSVIGFVLVLYATFLTRSGILGDTSVHSFNAPGKEVEILLIAFMVTFIIIGAGLLAWRYKEINNLVDNFQFKYKSKEFTLSIGSILILAFTLIVWYGTSKPVIEEILGQTKTAAELSFYNTWGLWFAIIILLLNAYSIFLKWKSNNFDNLAKQMFVPLVGSLILTGVMYFAGISGFNFLLLSFSSLFSLFTNADYIIRNISKQPKQLGAYIAHFGISVLVLGVVASGPFSQTEQLSIEQNQTKKAFGYEFTFSGKHRIEEHYTDREKYKYHIDITGNGAKTTVYPIIYWSNFNNMQAPFLEPGINSLISKDIYVSPKTIESISNAPRIDIKKDETVHLPIDNNWTMKVISYKMSDEFDKKTNRILMSVLVNFKSDSYDRIDTLYTMLDVDSWEGQPEWFTIPNTMLEVGMAGLIRDKSSLANSRAAFIFKKSNEPVPAPTELFIFDVTIKPFINLVWLGTIFMVVGYFWAIPKHLKSRKSQIVLGDSNDSEIQNSDNNEILDKNENTEI